MNRRGVMRYIIGGAITLSGCSESKQEKVDFGVRNLTKSKVEVSLTIETGSRTVLNQEVVVGPAGSREFSEVLDIDKKYDVLVENENKSNSTVISPRSSMMYYANIESDRITFSRADAD